VSDLANLLRERGLRLTPQRQQVLEALRRLGHATPEQIFAAVSAHVPGVNITTIYRTLELLEELNLVTHVHLSHGAPTYHYAGEDDLHVHMVCRNCEMVQELDTAELAPLAARLDEQYGFRLDIGHVSLFGVCRGCS
jgi:Fur family transcriptional regulator, ferric uptake regulator